MTALNYQQLKWLRLSHHLSQKDLAEKLSISRSYMSEIESGAKVPTLQILEKYSEVFGIPVSSVIWFLEKMSNPKLTPRIHPAMSLLVDITQLSYGKQRAPKSRASCDR